MLTKTNILSILIVIGVKNFWTTPDVDLQTTLLPLIRVISDVSCRRETLLIPDGLVSVLMYFSLSMVQ